MTIRRRRNPRKLFSIKLKNRITNKTLSATFYEPLRQRKYIKEHRTWIVLWNTRARTSIGDRVVRDESLPNESWLSSLLLAIEGLRILIPFEEEEDWLDESGLPSWLMLPKTIHVGWGHQLHKELVGTVNTHVAKFISKIDK